MIIVHLVIVVTSLQLLKCDAKCREQNTQGAIKEVHKCPCHRGWCGSLPDNCCRFCCVSMACRSDTRSFS